jgi:hypothetical protein
MAGEGNPGENVNPQNLIVNELLSYATYYLQSSTRDELHKTIYSFYNLDEVVVAKKILHNLHSDIIGEFIQRKSSTNRSELSAHLEDLMSAIYELDKENVSFKFGTMNFRRIPKWAPNQAFNFALAEKINALEARLLTQELVSSENKAEMVQMKDNFASLETRQEITERKTTQAVPTMADVVVNGRQQPQNVLGPMKGPSKKPPTVAAREAGQSAVGETLVLTQPQTSGVAVTQLSDVVPARNGNHQGEDGAKHQGEVDAKAKPASGTDDGEPFQLQPAAQKRLRRQQRYVAGTQTNVAGRVKGAPLANRDFFVHRVDKGTEAEDIKQFLLESGIVVNNVTVLSKDVALFRSFKVSVPLCECTKILNADLWPTGIRIRRFLTRKSLNENGE